MPITNELESRDLWTPREPLQAGAEAGWQNNRHPTGLEVGISEAKDSKLLSFDVLTAEQRRSERLRAALRTAGK